MKNWRFVQVGNKDTPELRERLRDIEEQIKNWEHGKSIAGVDEAQAKKIIEELRQERSKIKTEIATGNSKTGNEAPELKVGDVVEVFGKKGKITKIVSSDVVEVFFDKSGTIEPDRTDRFYKEEVKKVGNESINAQEWSMFKGLGKDAEKEIGNARHTKEQLLADVRELKKYIEQHKGEDCEKEKRLLGEAMEELDKYYGIIVGNQVVKTIKNLEIDIIKRPGESDWRWYIDDKDGNNLDMGFGYSKEDAIRKAEQKIQSGHFAFATTNKVGNAGEGWYTFVGPKQSKPKYREGQSVKTREGTGTVTKVQPMKLSATPTYKVKLESGKEIWCYEEEIGNKVGNGTPGTIASIGPAWLHGGTVYGKMDTDDSGKRHSEYVKITWLGEGKGGLANYFIDDKMQSDKFGSLDKNELKRWAEQKIGNAYKRDEGNGELRNEYNAEIHRLEKKMEELYRRGQGHSAMQVQKQIEQLQRELREIDNKKTTNEVNNLKRARNAMNKKNPEGLKLKIDDYAEQGLSVEDVVRSLERFGYDKEDIEAQKAYIKQKVSIENK